MKRRWKVGYIALGMTTCLSFSVYYLYNYSYYDQVCTAEDANAWIPRAQQLVFEAASNPTPEGVASDWRPTKSEANSWKAEDFVFLEFREVEGTVFEMRFKRTDRPYVYYDIGFFWNCGFGVSFGRVGDDG